MKHIQRYHARTINNNASCSVTEYPCDDVNIDMAHVNLSGRYPEKGWALNETCKEVCYIISGTGTITFMNTTLTLNEGDVVIIEKNEKYFWDGVMNFIITSTPAWHPTQHKIMADD